MNSFEQVTTSPFWVFIKGQGGGGGGGGRRDWDSENALRDRHTTERQTQTNSNTVTDRYTERQTQTNTVTDIQRGKHRLTL